MYTTDRTGSDGYVAGDYLFFGGTSVASPYAAGVAALVLSVNPALDAEGVEQVLQVGAVDLGPTGYDTVYGWGFVNANNALDCNGNGISDLEDINEGPPHTEVPTAMPTPYPTSARRTATTTVLLIPAKSLQTRASTVISTG